MSKVIRAGDPAAIRVVQVSDLHFPDAPGSRGLVAHDPDRGLAAVLDDAADTLADAALVVATGDLADLGEPGAYERLGDLTGTFEGRPVYVCPSTTYSVDYVGRVFDGPGYRVYTLHPDGRVESEACTAPGEITDAMRAKSAPRFLTDLMMGRVTIDELRAMTDAEFEERFGAPRPTRGA
ncbi:hypothetical protein [Yinghuangia seranimata]|uniref:hypothetical protein n=1 Tax=Yinghuangia seranimata TaxID=408067 RepID=UPI00248B37A4|nr:hypothetical protein [Yinghuangia seranimata]MDI2132761.1 hypothetical protein [Yinghuangia seranimata]